MFLIIPILLLLSGCGKSPGVKFGTPGSSSGVVVGKINWIEVNKNLNQEILKKTKAVADLYIPTNKSRCSGFLISSDILMTNFHCVPDSILAIGASANFSHESDSLEKDEYLCEEFIYSNEQLDFALIGCSGSPGEKFGYLKFDREIPTIDSKVYIVHHNCDYFENPKCDWTKKISPGKILNIDKTGIYNSSDTFLGSSGAPLLKISDGKILGIHHAGKISGSYQRGPYNVAIPALAILDDLKENRPDILDQLD